MRLVSTLLTRLRCSLPLVALAACDSETAEGIPAPELRLAEDMATVVLASWTPSGEAPDEVRLVWTTDAGEQSTPAVPDGEAWSAVAFGLGPAQEVNFRVVATWGGEESTSEDVLFETGTLPVDALTLEETGPNPGWLAVGINNAASGAAIFDEEGEAVWWWPLPVPTLLVTRVLRSIDQQSILVSSLAPIGDYDDTTLAIHRVAYDGTLIESVPTPGAHHDFFELPDGTLAWLSGEERSFGEKPIRGDVLMERSPDGVERMVWNSWDDFVYDEEDPRLDSRFLHANAVKYDAATARYWISLRSLGSLVVIDQASGDIVEQYFGDEPTHTLSAGTPLSFQHSFTLLDDGFLIMDDRAKEAETSRAAEFTIDRGAGTFRETWSFESDQGLHIQGLGDALRLDDGDSLLVWSSAGQLQRVSSDGSTLWRGTTQLGTILGYGQHTTDPTALPR